MTDCSCTNFPASLGNVTFGASVGIGTSSPAATLDVQGGRIRQAGSAAITGYLETNSGMLASTTALNPGLLVFGGDGSNALYGMDLGYNGHYRLRLLTGGVVADFAFGYYSVANPTQQSAFTEVVTITGSGNVGIGTTGPAARLQVVGTDAAQLLLTNSAGFDSIQADNEVRLHTPANAAQTLKVGALAVTSSYANNPPANGLYVEGNVGIGTSAPGYPLDVAGTIRSTGALLGGDQLMSGALKDSTGNRVNVDAGGCYYAD